MGGHATKWGVFAAHFWGAFTGRLDELTANKLNQASGIPIAWSDQIP